MRKLCFNKPLLLFLVTAFLFLQWSGTHIHLADDHEHGGDKHQHAVTTHQHQLASHHADAIDVGGDTFAHFDNNKVVEVEHACNKFHGSLDEQFVAIPADTWFQFKRDNTAVSLKRLSHQETYHTYYQYTSVRLRAPPIAS